MDELIPAYEQIPRIRDLCHGLRIRIGILIIVAFCCGIISGMLLA